jgi:hypothetical protein
VVAARQLCELLNAEEDTEEAKEGKGDNGDKGKKDGGAVERRVKYTVGLVGGSGGGGAGYLEVKAVFTQLPMYGQVHSLSLALSLALSLPPSLPPSPSPPLSLSLSCPLDIPWTDMPGLCTDTDTDLLVHGHGHGAAPCAHLQAAPVFRYRVLACSLVVLTGVRCSGKTRVT